MQHVFHCVLLSLFLIAFAGSSSPKENRQFRHDYEYYPNANGWFKFHKIPATWENARSKCFFEGAVLASPINHEVQYAMQQIMDNYGHFIFTGIQSLTSTGDYFSVEGVHLIEMPVEWVPDQPDNQGDDERCLTMWRDGTVADVRCSEPRPFICYKNKTKDLVMNTCGTSDKEYVEVAPGHCYKYHVYCEDWWRAHMICSSEGGHLAVINSESEAQLIHGLFAYKLQTAKCGDKTFFLLGFRNPDGEATGSPYWFTVQGETLEEAGYAKWGAKQPDNSGNKEYCGWGYFEQNSVSFNDAPCSTKKSFICEINGPRKPFTDRKY